MDTRYNILYFPNNVDIRLCPKNATVSLKTAWYFTTEHESVYLNPNGSLNCPIGEAYRQETVEKLSSYRNFPFRKDSIKIAIKRDPVERFLSAACYYTHHQKLYNSHLYSKKHYDVNFIQTNKELPIYPKEEFTSINHIIEALESGIIKDSHFYSQSYYLGHPDDYDYVFNINNLSPLWDFLSDNCNPRNKLTPKDLKRNATRKNLEFKHTASEKDKELIREFFEKDYRRGWC